LAAMGFSPDVEEHPAIIKLTVMLKIAIILFLILYSRVRFVAAIELHSIILKNDASRNLIR
jgi:hypothetical protein